MVRTLPSNACSGSSTPGGGAKIPQAPGPKNQNITQKQSCNNFNKDFTNGLHPKKKKSLKEINKNMHMVFLER